MNRHHKVSAYLSWTIVTFVIVALLGLAACAQPAQQAPAKPAEPAKPAAPAPAPAAKPAEPAKPAAEPAKPAAQPAAPAQTYRYRLGIVVTREALGGEFGLTFIEAAKQKSNGQIQIDFFDKAQLGGETEMLGGVRLGTLDMAILGSGIVGQVEPTFSMTELPFLWKSPEHVHKMLDGQVGQRMMSLLEPKGIKGLVFGEWGQRELLVRTKPVNNADDVKGLKVRVIENPIYVSTWRTFGANPVPMAWPEVYTGLQQGTIDAVDTNPIGMRDAKLYEVAKHLARTSHIYTVLVLMMNLEKWKALPPNLQQALMEAAKEGQKANRERAKTENDKAIEIMQQNGVRVTNPDVTKFRAEATKVHQQFATQVGPDLLKQVQEAQ
jgi:tripartite ATP-independent transporter DctP family solute receptor